MEKSMIKQKEKGITMVVLVVTILVLLILAGISVAVLYGPNGIITRANEAKMIAEMVNARERVDTQILRKL